MVRAASTEIRARIVPTALGRGFDFTFREYGSVIKSALIPSGPSSSWTQGEPGTESRISGVFRDQANCASSSLRFGEERQIKSLRWLKRPRQPPKRQRRLRAPTSNVLASSLASPSCWKERNPRTLHPGPPGGE